jgi:hypothetical protein
MPQLHLASVHSVASLGYVYPKTGTLLASEVMFARRMNPRDWAA